MIIELKERNQNCGEDYCYYDIKIGLTGEEATILKKYKDWREGFATNILKEMEII